ncbi:MAG: DUF4102 domain-containing protein [Campylobacterales bacterium]|nr:DUF4102 domain-containing protein [Campylobacterales bacterium]
MSSNQASFSTIKEIKALKSQEKNYTCSDLLTKGLQLIVRADGGKQWAFRYTSPTQLKRRQTGLGTYPSVTLEIARKKANQLREEIAKGVDPLEVKAEIKEQNIHDDKSQFHKVVYQWIDEIIAKNNATITINKITRTFQRDVFPCLCTYDSGHNIVSSTPISQISHADILKIVK